MHPCLQIDELLEAIVAYVRTHGAGNLVSMALTCRTFYEPSMDRVWSDLPGLGPLIRCLPHVRLSKADEADGDGTNLRVPVNIADTPLPEEWERLRIHARRVRSLHVDHSAIGMKQQHRADIRCYEVLKAHYPELPLFPNLRKLCYIDDRSGPASGALIPYLAAFLPCTLEEMDNDRAPLNDALILEWLQQFAPALRTFRGNRCHLPGAELGLGMDRFTKALYSFRHLTDLSVQRPFDATTLHHLASFPQLSSFIFVVNSNNYRLLMPSKSPFPALKELDISESTVDSSNDVGHITEFLNRIRPRSLTTLYVFAIHCLPQADLVWGFLESIGNHPSIERLHVVLGCDTPLPMDVAPVAESVVEPLKRLKLLTGLNIRGIPITFTGPGFAKLAYAWPYLDHMSFRACMKSPSQVRFCDLIPFAKRCPRLRSFSFIPALHLPAREDFAEEEHLKGVLAEQASFSSQLELLSIGPVAPLTADYASQIGAFLAEFFPAVDALLWNDTDGQPSVDRIMAAKARCLAGGVLAEAVTSI